MRSAEISAGSPARITGLRKRVKSRIFFRTGSDTEFIYQKSQNTKFCRSQRERGFSSPAEDPLWQAAQHYYQEQLSFKNQIGEVFGFYFFISLLVETSADNEGTEVYIILVQEEDKRSQSCEVSLEPFSMGLRWMDQSLYLTAMTTPERRFWTLPIAC